MATKKTKRGKVRPNDFTFLNEKLDEVAKKQILLVDVFQKLNERTMRQSIVTMGALQLVGVLRKKGLITDEEAAEAISDESGSGAAWLQGVIDRLPGADSGGSGERGVLPGSSDAGDSEGEEVEGETETGTVKSSDQAADVSPVVECQHYGMKLNAEAFQYECPGCDFIVKEADVIDGSYTLPCQHSSFVVDGSLWTCVECGKSFTFFEKSKIESSRNKEKE